MTAKLHRRAWSVAASGVGAGRRHARRVPRSVWALTLVFAALLSTWSLLAPALRGPDEVGHVDLAVLLAEGGDYPAYDERATGTALVKLWIGHIPGLEISGEQQWLTADSAVPRGSRKDFEAMGGGAPMAGTGNQIAQHPPLYYRLMSLVVRAERAFPGERSLDQEVHLLGLANVALVSPLPLLAWAAARRLGAARNAAVTAAAVPLALPQLIHIGSVVNNDNLLILLAGVLAVLVAGVLRGDTRTVTAVAIGLLGGLALLTKGFAFALMPWIALGYLVQARRSPRPRRSLARLALAGAIVAVTGGWWVSRNLLRYGTPMPSILDEPLSRHPAGFEARPLWYARHFASTITQRFWGNFGSYEAPLGQVVVVVATATVALLVVAAIARSRTAGDASRSSGPTRADLVWFTSVLVVVLALVGFRAFALYRSSGQLPFIQGRYLFCAIVPFAVIVGVGAHRLAARWSTLWVLLGAAITQVDATRAALRGWWAEPTASIGRSVDAWLAWSPWPVGVVLVSIGAVLASACWAVVCLAGDAGRLDRHRSTGTAAPGPRGLARPGRSGEPPC